MLSGWTVSVQTYPLPLHYDRPGPRPFEGVELETEAPRRPLGWELAGLETDSVYPYGWRVESEARSLGRYVAAPAIKAGNARRVFPDRDLLLRFVDLASAPDEDITGFAGRWGMLGLCRSGLAPGHEP